jgi:hypothetical protein
VDKCNRKDPLYRPALTSNNVRCASKTPYRDGSTPRNRRSPGSAGAPARRPLQLLYFAAPCSTQSHNSLSQVCACRPAGKLSPANQAIAANTAQKTKAAPAGAAHRRHRSRLEITLQLSRAWPLVQTCQSLPAWRRPAGVPGVPSPVQAISPDIRNPRPGNAAHHVVRASISPGGELRRTRTTVAAV